MNNIKQHGEILPEDEHIGVYPRNAQPLPRRQAPSNPYAASNLVARKQTREGYR